MATLTSLPVLSTTSERIDDLLFRITEKLQLTDTQYDQATQSYGAICNWLDADDSPLRPYHPQLYPQGSVSLGTTVKPRQRDEYDVDLVCQLAIDGSLLDDPIILLDMIEQRLRENAVYEPLVERKNRCIRVNYERQFHLDILPACPDYNAGGSCLLIPDVKLDRFCKTNPKGFIAWFKSQTLKRRSMAFDEAIKGAAMPLPDPQPAHHKQILQLAVQLFKRWRDIYYSGIENVAPVSIILTTLSGKHYGGEQSIIRALASIAEGITEAIPSAGRLIVTNPANAEEDLSDRWKDPVVYEAFLHGMRAFAAGVRDLRKANSIVEATSLIKEMFGAELTKTVFSDQLRELEKPRQAEKLGVSPSLVLSGVSAVASVPVRRNTFFGD